MVFPAACARCGFKFALPNNPKVHEVHQGSWRCMLREAVQARQGVALADIAHEQTLRWDCLLCPTAHQERTCSRWPHVREHFAKWHPNTKVPTMEEFFRDYISTTNLVSATMCFEPFQSVRSRLTGLIDWHGSHQRKPGASGRIFELCCTGS